MTHNYTPTGIPELDELLADGYLIEVEPGLYQESPEATADRERLEGKSN